MSLQGAIGSAACQAIQTANNLGCIPCLRVVRWQDAFGNAACPVEQPAVHLAVVAPDTGDGTHAPAPDLVASAQQARVTGPTLAYATPTLRLYAAPESKTPARVG